MTQRKRQRPNGIKKLISNNVSKGTTYSLEEVNNYFDEKLTLSQK